MTPDEREAFTWILAGLAMQALITKADRVMLCDQKCEPDRIAKEASKYASKLVERLEKGEE